MSSHSPALQSGAHLPLPLGFSAHVTNIGVKDTTDDFTVVAADQVCAAAGV